MEFITRQERIIDAIERLECFISTQKDISETILALLRTHDLIWTREVIDYSQKYGMLSLNNQFDMIALGNAKDKHDKMLKYHESMKKVLSDDLFHSEKRLIRFHKRIETLNTEMN